MSAKVSPTQTQIMLIGVPSTSMFIVFSICIAFLVAFAVTHWRLSQHLASVKASIPFTKHHLEDLNQFLRDVWGNDEALNQRHDSGSVVIDVGEYFGAFQELTAGILANQWILPRTEYAKALGAILTSNRYARGAYIVGHPGIGKTYCLLYLLANLLYRRQPVAIPVLSGEPFYLFFCEAGVTCHLFSDEIHPLQKYNLVWALCDSNDFMQIPPAIFRRHAATVRIIQTTSPEVSRWKGWSKQSGAKPFIMDVWTAEEIEELAGLYGVSHQRISVLGSTWGRIPRSLLEYARTKDRDIEEYYHRSAVHAVENSDIFLQRAVNLDIKRDSFSPEFYFLRPMRLPDGRIRREQCCVHVPTWTLFDILAAALQTQDNKTKIQFYRALSQRSETRQGVRVVYESWVHSYLTAGRSIVCQWITGDVDVLPEILEGSKNLVSSSRGTIRNQRRPYYWIPSSSTYPGIDGAQVRNRLRVAFQVTIASKHRSPSTGLERLKADLGKKPKGYTDAILFIGPDEAIIDIATRHSKDRNLRNFAVGWSIVDPVASGVVYRAFRKLNEDELYQLAP